MDRHQMEMRFEEPQFRCRNTRPRRRLTRARWWFQQMRMAVDQAPDWDSVTHTPPPADDHCANS